MAGNAALAGGELGDSDFAFSSTLSPAFFNSMSGSNQQAPKTTTTANPVKWNLCRMVYRLARLILNSSATQCKKGIRSGLTGGFFLGDIEFNFRIYAFPHVISISNLLSDSRARCFLIGGRGSTSAGRGLRS